MANFQKALKVAALAGFIAAIYQTVLLWKEWQHLNMMGTALYFLPIAALAAAVSWISAKHSPLFSLSMAAFAWMNAALI